MKPVQGNEQNCQCKNCTFKTEIERPFIKRFIEEGSKIDRLYLGKYLPLREKKLLNKLLKTKAEYDDVRNEIIALSASSVGVKEKAGLKPTNKKPRHRDETERSSAVSGLAGKGASELAGGRERIGECCSCCSCGSILDDYGKTSRPFSRGGHAHKRGSHSSYKLRDKIKFKRRRRFRPKNISSAPCTCQAKISCIKEELNKEMALHSAKSRAEFKLQEVEREKIKKKYMKRMRKFQRKESFTSRIKITKQIKGRMYKSTDEEYDSTLKITTESTAGKLTIKKSEEEKQKHTVAKTLPKQETAFRSKELERSRNKITTEQPATKYRQEEDSEESESFYTSTEDSKDRKVKLDRFKKRRAKQESMVQNLDYSKFVQKRGKKVESKRISPDKKPLEVGLKESKSTVSANIPTEEEQKPPSKVIDISKQLALNAHRYSKTGLRRSVDKGAIKLKAKRSRMKTNIQGSARKSLNSAKKIRNKIKEKFGLEKSLQVMKRPKTASQKSALRKGDKHLLVIKDITRSQPGIRRLKGDEESEDEFLKKEHRKKHKEHLNQSTKIYKQTKRKNKILGLDTKRKNKKIGDVSPSSSFTKSTVSSPSLITKISGKAKSTMSKHKKVDKEMGCRCIEDEFQKIEHRSKHKELRSQSTKIYKQTKRKDKILGLDTKRKNRKIGDVSSSSSFTKSTVSTPSLITKTSGKAKMTMSKHRKVDMEIKCRCIEDEFKKIDHKVKNKDIRNQSTKMYKLTKIKDKNVGELTKQRPEDSNLQKIPARTYVNIQSHEKEPTVGSDKKPPGAKPKHANKRIRKISISISANKKRVGKHKVNIHKTKHETKSPKSAKSVSSATSKQSIRAASTDTVNKDKKPKQKQNLRVKSIPEKSTLSSKGSNLRARPEFKPKKRGRSLEKKGHRLQRKHSQRSTSTVKSQNSNKYSLRRCMCTLKLVKQNKVKATKVKPKRVSKGSITTQENIGDTLRLGLSNKSIPLDNAEKLGKRRKRLPHYECEPGICVPDKCDPHNCLKLINSREKIVMKHYGKKSNTENPSIKSSSTVTSKSATPSKSKRVLSKLAIYYETGVPARKYNEKVAATPQKVLPSSNIPNRQAVKISSSFNFNIEFYKDRSLSPRSEKSSTKRVSRLGSVLGFKSSDFIKPKLRISQRNIKQNRKSSVTQVGVKQKNTLIGTTIKRCFCTLKLKKAAKKKIKIKDTISKRISDISTQKSSVSSSNVSDGSRRRNERSDKSQKARNNEILVYQLKQSIDKIHSRQTVGISSMFSFEHFYKYCLPIETKLCAKGPINDRLDLMSNKFNNKTEIVMRNQESQTNAASKGIIAVLKDCFCKLQIHKQSDKLTNGKVAMSLTETTITAKKHSLSYERKPRTLEIAYFKCGNKTKVGNNFNLDLSYNKSAPSGIKSDYVNEHSNFNYEVSENVAENNVLEYQTKKKSGYFNDVNQKLPDTIKSNSFKLSGIHQLFKSSFYTMNVLVPDKIKRHKLQPDECEPGICIPTKCHPYECLKRINKRLMKRTSTITTTASRTTTGHTVRKPRRARQVQSKKHVREKHARNKYDPTKQHQTISTTSTVYKPVPSSSQRQVAGAESTSMSVASVKSTKSSTRKNVLKQHRPKHPKRPVKSVSPSKSVGTVESTKSRTRKNVLKQHRPKHPKKPVKSVSPSMSVGSVKSTKSRTRNVLKHHRPEHRKKPVKSVSPSMSVGTVQSTKSTTRKNVLKQHRPKHPKKPVKSVSPSKSVGTVESTKSRTRKNVLKQHRPKHPKKPVKSVSPSMSVGSVKSTKSTTRKNVLKQHRPKHPKKPVKSVSPSMSVGTVKSTKSRSRKNVLKKHRPKHPKKPGKSVSTSMSVGTVKSSKSRTRRNVLKQPRPKHRQKPVKSVSPSMSVGTVKSTKSTIRRNKGIKPNKADRHNRIGKAVTKVVDSGSSVSHRVKRCLCTLKLQKKAKHKAKEPVSTTSQSTMAHKKSKKIKHRDRIKRNANISSSRSRSIVSNIGERRRKHVRSRKRERGRGDVARLRSSRTKAAPPATEYLSTATERQVCKIGSSFNFSIEFHKGSIPTADHVQAAAKKLKSQHSRTSRKTNVRRTKLKQKYTKPIRQKDSSKSTVSKSPSKVGHTGRSQAKIAQVHNRGITPMLKRCFCTLKLQKQGKYSPNHKEMKLVANANKVAAHATETNQRGTQRKLKPYECEPGICVPGQCDPYQCQKWINQRLKREFGTSPAHRHAYKSVASTIGTRKKGRKIQHGSKRHKSTASVTTTKSKRRKMQHGGPRQTNVSSMSSVSRPSKARRIQHTGPSRSRKLQYTSKEPRQTTPSYIVSDTLSRPAVKISSSFQFNIDFYKDRSGVAAQRRRERPPPSPSRPAPKPLSIVTRPTTSRATLHSGVGTHPKKTRSGETQFKKPKQAQAKSGNQLLKRCFCTLALKRKKLPARSSEVSTATRKRHVEPTLSEVSTVTKRARTRVKPTLTEISTVTKKEHVRPTDRHIATKTRRLEPYECEPYVCIPGKCNPRECLKRIQRRNMRNLSTTTAHDNTRSIGTTRTNVSRPIKIQYKGRAKDAHSKMPRPHVRDAHAKSPTLYVKDSHSTSPKRYVRDAHSVSSRRKVRDVQSTVTQRTTRQTVSRTLRGPSPQPQRQATKIGSSFSFDIEFYKNKTLKTGKQQEHHEEKRHKPVNRTSKHSSASISPRHKKIQKHKKHRTSPSHIDKAKSIQSSSMTESPPLKRCFCTLGLLDKNQAKQTRAITKRPQNVYVLLQPKGFTPKMPYKSNARKLDPYECEPGICIPGECDPYQCARRMQGRHVNSKMIGTDRYGRSSSSSITPNSTRAMQTQSCSPRCRYQKTQGDQYTVEIPRFNPVSRPITPTKQAVRIGSNFSFNIEFYKEGPEPNVPEAVPLEESQQEMRYTKPVPRSVRNRGVHSERPSYSNRHSQARGASMESRGVGPLLKRCFCTLGLLQKNKKQQVQKRKPPVVTKETATVTVGTNRRFSKLQPYECEPGICFPGKCDPYECLERMKRGHTRDFGTGSYHPFNRQASTYTSSDAVSRGISPSSRNKYRNQSTTCPREKMKRTKPVSEYIAEPSVPTSGNAHRQAVRIGSNFGFNIEFFKDRKSPAYPEKTAYKTYDYEPNSNFIHETKQKRPSVSRGYGDNVNYRNYASQMTGPKRESIGSGMGPLLKRCFCTLKLQKGPYGRTETVNYMCLPPTPHIKTKITQNVVGCINDIAPSNLIDRNCTKTNKIEFKAVKQVIKVCPLTTTCRKDQPSRIIKVIKNVFIALKHKYSESKPKVQCKSDKVARVANEKDKKRSRKDSHLVKTNNITDKKNNNKTFSALSDKVQKSCICNEKQRLSNIKRNAGCNEMKTIFPYVPTKYNNNVSKTLIIQNNKLKSVLRSSGKYCSHCDKTKSTTDNKYSSFKAVTKSNRIPFINSSNPKIKVSKIINFKQIKRNLLQLFKRDRKELSVNINEETNTNINLRKDKIYKGIKKQKDEILKTSKSDRHPTSSKFNFIPKKSNSLKITKISEKKKRGKNCLMFVEQGVKKYSRYQSGDAEQNVVKTNKKDGLRRSVVLCKHKKSAYINFHPSHNQGKHNLITTNPPYMNNKVVQFALVSPKREFKKKCYRTANTDECVEDLCRTEHVGCPCGNRNKKRMARILDQKVQDLHRINQKTKTQNDNNIHITNKNEIKKQVDSSPKYISEKQTGVCETKKPCECCHGKKKKKTEPAGVDGKCVQDCTIRETKNKKKQKEESDRPSESVDRTPLFEMKLEANSMDILNKEHVSDIVRRLRPTGKDDLKEFLKTHGKSCQCCICKTARKQGVDVENLTVELPILSKKTKRKLKLKPCVCGSIECARESTRQAHKKALSLLPKRKPCVCGTDICEHETLKVEQKRKLKKKKKGGPKHIKGVKSKKNLKKIKRSNKKRNERALLSRQKKYKEEDDLRKKRKIKADKYMQKQVRKYATASDKVLMVESVLDVGKLGVTTLTTVMRCIFRAIVDPKNAYRKIKTGTQDPTRICINVKDAVGELGIKPTAQRVRYRIRAMRMVEVFMRRVEGQPFFNFLANMFNNNPKKRMMHKKIKRRRREPIEFGCSLFMASLRTRPHLWLYYFCPWFYPHCIGMLQILRNFSDAMLFILAVFVWSPCILAIEICRTLMCCTLCTG